MGFKVAPDVRVHGRLGENVGIAQTLQEGIRERAIGLEPTRIVLRRIEPRMHDIGITMVFRIQKASHLCLQDTQPIYSRELSPDTPRNTPSMFACAFLRLNHQIADKQCSCQSINVR